MTAPYRRRTEGQAIVIVALAFVVLVAFLGLALDGANAFGQRRRVNNAADAASLAATRIMIDIKSDGRQGQVIDDTIREFLVNDHSIDAATSTWQASYVSRDTPDTIIGPVVDNMAPPNNANGVRVDLTLTFDTFFMGVLGQRTLTVGATSTSIYGPLGTAVGQDLIPLAISDAAMNTLLHQGHIRVDLRGKIMNAYGYLAPGEQLPPEIADVVTDANFAHVSFRNVAGAPETGNDCLNPTLTENLTYWWCQGTPNQLSINRELPSGDPTWGALSSAIIYRASHRPTAVVPVFVPLPDGHGGIYFQLAYFVAVTIDYNYSMESVRMTLLNNYVSAGAMIGEGSGVETGVWAVNLKR
jgi:Flp pilus assembly protein TadG